MLSVSRPRWRATWKRVHMVVGTKGVVGQQEEQEEQQQKTINKHFACAHRRSLRLARRLTEGRPELASAENRADLHQSAPARAFIIVFEVQTSQIHGRAPSWRPGKQTALAAAAGRPASLSANLKAADGLVRARGVQ